VLDGSLFTNIAEIYNSLVNIDGPQAMKLAEGILSSALGAAKDFIKSWDSDDMYNKWFFRGKIVGMIVTEVVLAIVTAGSSLGAKMTSKLLAAFPKLGKVAAKLLKAADKLDFNKKKKRSGGNFGADDADGAELPEANDFDNVDPGDKKQMQLLQALGCAQILTNANDVIDTPVPILLKQLETMVASKFPAVSGYKANALPEPGHYEIVQFAKVSGNYTTKPPKFPFFTHLQGKSLKTLRKRADEQGWIFNDQLRTGRGWTYKDDTGLERLRFRENPDGKFLHEQTGYIRWCNAKGECLDLNGKPVLAGGNTITEALSVSAIERMCASTEEFENVMSAIHISVKNFSYE
jgi:hypothetical protein